MTSYLILKLLHILGFVYWLGGDLGTFFASRFVADSKLSPPQRATALKIMLGCDQGPKLCMPLIFALGFQMGVQTSFIVVPGFVTVAVWLVTLAWFANVNYLYFTHNAEAKARLGKIDFWFRIAVVIGLLVAGVMGLFGQGFIRADWLALKIMIFAGLVACGIYIRIQLKPFVPAFGKLMTEGSSPKVETVLKGSIARCRPAVYLIWAGLIANAALGLHIF